MPANAGVGVEDCFNAHLAEIEGNPMAYAGFQKMMVCQAIAEQPAPSFYARLKISRAWAYNPFMAQNLEVAAGVKQQLQADAKRLPGLRLLDGRFMVINQAMGIPKSSEAGLKYVRDFVEEMKASGFVAEALKRHRIEGAAVAAAQP